MWRFYNYESINIKITFLKRYYEQDYFVSSNNYSAFKLIDSWPNWPGKYLIYLVKKVQEKPILSKILEKKIKKAKLIDAKEIENKIIEELHTLDCLIIDNYSNNINEKILYSILNQSKQRDVFILIKSTTSIKHYNFELEEDLSSRINSFIFIGRIANR